MPASQDENDALFAVIAGSNPSENYLSRLFRACFVNSPVFAQTALSAIWRGAKLSGPVPNAVGWQCHYQPNTPVNGGGHPDLCLLPPPSRNGGSSFKPVWLESKVGSHLGEHQLRKYKEYGAEVLVAITKNWPEVTQTRLSALGVKALRWQDICREMRQAPSAKKIDAFLCSNFADYLEWAEMAYREDITTGALNELRAIFVKVSLGSGHGSSVPGIGSFGVADDCMALLKDVRQLFRERMPALAKWKNWGPGYWHEFIDEDNKSAGVDGHTIAFGLYPKRWVDKRVVCGVWFPTTKQEEVYLYFTYADGDYRRDKSVSLLKGMSKGKLDAHKIAGALCSAVKSWQKDK